MRWLGRGRALYKLSIGGHSALVSKDHVCESGFPVRNPFAKGRGCSPCRSLPRATRGGGGGQPRPTAPGLRPRGYAGQPRREARSWGRGEGAGQGPGQRAGTARRARPVGGPLPPLDAAREAPAPERQAGSRPGAGDGGGGRQRAWPGTAGSGASLAEGGLARSGFRGFRRDHSPERGEPGSPSRTLGCAESRGGAEEAGRSVCWFS